MDKTENSIYRESQVQYIDSVHTPNTIFHGATFEMVQPNNNKYFPRAMHGHLLFLMKYLC